MLIVRWIFRVWGRLDPTLVDLVFDPGLTDEHVLSEKLDANYNATSRLLQGS